MKKSEMLYWFQIRKRTNCTQKQFSEKSHNKSAFGHNFFYEIVTKVKSFWNQRQISDFHNYINLFEEKTLALLVVVIFLCPKN
jgi:hypothetical protein